MPSMFALTKREQRIVIVILLLVVAGMVIKRAREPQFAPPEITSTPQLNVTPPADGDEDRQSSGQED